MWQPHLFPQQHPRRAQACSEPFCELGNAPQETCSGQHAAVPQWACFSFALTLTYDAHSHSSTLLYVFPTHCFGFTGLFAVILILMFIFKI